MPVQAVTVVPRFGRMPDKRGHRLCCVLHPLCRFARCKKFMATEFTYPLVTSPTSQELPGLSEARFVDDAAQNDIPPATYNFRLYSGKMLELYGRNLYKLDGKLCQGAFTGDDFCAVS